MLVAMGFSPWRQVHGRASIADFFKPRRRCGIYVLRFSKEEFYVGQAVDVTRACYEPGLRIPTACWRKRQANATKCNPATVSGSLS